jgi:hypothetical protein
VALGEGLGDGGGDGPGEPPGDGDAEAVPLGDGFAVERTNAGQSLVGMRVEGIDTSTPGWPSRATQSRL